MGSIGLGQALRRGGVPRVLSVAGSILIVSTAFGGTPTLAHTDVESISPADDSVVDGPVDEVVIVFKRAVTETTAGFEVLTEAGDQPVPVVLTDDARRHVLRFDPPLSDGEVAVRYEVRAEDGHTISGGFRFTVIGPPAGAVPVTIPPTTVVDEQVLDVTVADVTEPDVTEPDLTEPDVTEPGPMVPATSAPDDMSPSDMSRDEMPADAMSMDEMSAMDDDSDDSSLTALPVAVYPTLGVAAVGGLAAAKRLRARR